MANKKINQLVLKTTIQSTDLFPLGDPTTGQLFKKTVAELQAAIGGAVISVNGLVGTVVLDTDDIQELATPTNRYFTEARARAAISLTTTGNSGASTYSNSTGVLNVPTYTLAGLGGITASFLSGGTGITYNSSTGVISYSGTVYTDSSIRALLSGANGISYNSSTGQFTYSGTVYTDSSIRALLSGTAPITYNSSTGAIGITQATTSTDGYLSSTDWNTFNGKQSALTLGNFTEATSSVLTITGGTGSVIGSGTSIQVKQSSSSVSGFLSSTDWNTFNNKQGTITLTTTGTSGAATFSGGTLNIPQYQAVLTNPVTGTGTASFHARWTSSSAIGVSNIFEDSNGTLVISGTSTTGTAGSGSSRGNLILAGATSNKITFNNNSTTINGFIYSDSAELNLSAGAGFMVLQAGNAERMRITSAGNVGIGTSSPNQLLTLSASAYPILGFSIGSTAQGYIGSLNGGGIAINSQIAQPLMFFTNDTERMRITSGTNVGIGTTSPGKLLTLNESTGTTLHTLKMSSSTTGVNGYLGMWYGQLRMTVGTSYDTTNGWVRDTSTSPAQIYMNSSNGYSYITFDTSVSNANEPTERMRVEAGGNILIGTTTDNGERLYVGGSIRATGSITANSDARLKKNIERIENALEKVGQISGYTYNTIYDEDRHAGVIAQEIDKVLPEIVNKGNDGLMGVEYGNISALLIEAIKDLKKDNESLRAIVEGLRK